MRARYPPDPDPVLPLSLTTLLGDHFEGAYDFFVLLPALSEVSCSTNGDDDGGGGDCRDVFSLDSIPVVLPIVPKYALLPKNPLLATGLDGDHWDIEYDCLGLATLAPEVDGGGGGCE
jgi:hypothetical protein